MIRKTLTSLILVAAIAATLVLVVRFYLYIPPDSPASSTIQLQEPAIDSKVVKPEEIVTPNPLIQDQTASNSAEQSPLETIKISTDELKLIKPHEFWHDAQEILRASFRVEDLVVAAIYDQIVDTDFGGNNLALAEASLLKAYYIDHTHFLVNHQIMTFCSRKPESTLCSFPYVQNLRQVDGENAALLNELSIVYYQNFDFNQALYLLNRAAVVEKSDNYYGRYIQAIDNALTFNRIRFMRTRQNLNLYPKLAAASVNANFSSIIKMCDERVGLQLEQWRISCRDAGKNIADLSANTLGEGYGVRQYVRYAGINLRDQNQAIVAVTNLRARVVGDLLGNEDVSNTRIPSRVWESFITDLRDKGEAEAYSNLEEKMSVFQKRRFYQ